MFPKIDSISAIEKFTVTSGALRVTDPCYALDTWCSGQLENVLNGVWHAWVGYYKDLDDQRHWAGFIEREREDLKRQRENFAKLVKEQGGEVTEEALDLTFKIQEQHIAKREAEMKACPGRVAYISILHESQFPEAFPDGYGAHIECFKPEGYEKADLHVGVDSGQAGFFDLVKYTEAQSDHHFASCRGDSPIFEAFYESCGKHTLDESKSFGAIEFGAVSQSGYGDGGYDCFAKRDESGAVTAAFILFIGSDEVDEDFSEE
jgi:hypothetical protein